VSPTLNLLILIFLAFLQFNIELLLLTITILKINIYLKNSISCNSLFMSLQELGVEQLLDAHSRIRIFS